MYLPELFKFPETAVQIIPPRLIKPSQQRDDLPHQLWRLKKSKTVPDCSAKGRNYHPPLCLELHSCIRVW